MWYVFQCQSGKEESVLHACRRALSPEAMEDAFLFRCERLWRSDGAWKPVIRTMFPGYVFLESSRPRLLSAELGRCTGGLPGWRFPWRAGRLSSGPGLNRTGVSWADETGGSALE